VGGDDVGAFFPVDVRFNGQGSLAGLGVVSVSRVNGGGDDPPFSVDAIVTADEYLVV
jgi:coatomer subunit delta